jgi:hypothetical protein
MIAGIAIAATMPTGNAPFFYAMSGSANCDDEENSFAFTVSASASVSSGGSCDVDQIFVRIYADTDNATDFWLNASGDNVTTSENLEGENGEDCNSGDWYEDGGTLLCASALDTWSVSVN